MFQQAKEVVSTDLGPDELPNGSEFTAKIAASSAKIRKNGGLSFNVKLEIVEAGHPYEGGEIWDSLHLSAGDGQGGFSKNQLQYNQRLFGKLQGAGLSDEFFASNPSNEAIAKAIKGNVIRVKIQWQEPTDDGRIFTDNTTTWSPLDGAPAASGGGGYVPSSGPTKGF